jgi:hypothetical protein
MKQVVAVFHVTGHRVKKKKRCSSRGFLNGADELSRVVVDAQIVGVRNVSVVHDMQPVKLPDRIASGSNACTVRHVWPTSLPRRSRA